MQSCVAPAAFSFASKGSAATPTGAASAPPAAAIVLELSASTSSREASARSRACNFGSSAALPAGASASAAMLVAASACALRAWLVAALADAAAAPAALGACAAAASNAAGASACTMLAVAGFRERRLRPFAFAAVGGTPDASMVSLVAEVPTGALPAAAVARGAVPGLLDVAASVEVTCWAAVALLFFGLPLRPLGLDAAPAAAGTGAIPVASGVAVGAL